MTATGSVLVIGYGNPLRGDDALGWVAADRLAGGDRAGARIISRQQLTPDLAADVADAAAVLFIDASADGQPGEFRCRPVRPADATPQSMTHHVTPEVVLACAQALFGRSPRAWLLSIAGADFELGRDGLSPAVRAALPRLLAEAERIIVQIA